MGESCNFLLKHSSLCKGDLWKLLTQEIACYRHKFLYAPLSAPPPPQLTLKLLRVPLHAHSPAEALCGDFLGCTQAHNTVVEQFGLIMNMDVQEKLKSFFSR